MDLTASVLGRDLTLDGALTKTCETCDGSGTIEIDREATMFELTDAQIQSLLHADLYRETGGEEADVDQHKSSMQRGPNTPHTGSVPSGRMP